MKGNYNIKIFKKTLSLLICTLCAFSFIPANIYANDEVAEEPEICEITVLETITEEDLEKEVNAAFEKSGADIVVTNYIKDPYAVQPYGNYQTNTKTFSFLSYAYSIQITVGGYLNGGYSVSGFNCTYYVSNSIIVVNSITYHDATTTQARATVIFTLNGQVPHTYRVEAYLLGSITLYQ